MNSFRMIRRDGCVPQLSQGRASRCSRLAVIAILMSTTLVAAGAGGYVYARASAGQILPGVRAAGVDVGGLSPADARRAVSVVVRRRLRLPLTVVAGGRRWATTPWALGVRGQVADAVDRALSISRSVSWVTSAYDRLAGATVDRSIAVSYAVRRVVVQSFVARVAVAVFDPARNAAMTVRGDRLVAIHPRSGRALAVKASVRDLIAALSSGRSRVKLPVRGVAPTVTATTLGETITVDLSTNTLRLYKGLRATRAYPVATAQPGFTTPIGVWQVEAKEHNPAWYNPAPDGWGAGMPLYIPPGPENPLGLRALGLNAPGVFIHGTPETWSVGTYASHGCIRMFENDAIALYRSVPLGTRVIIYGAPPWGNATSGNTAGA